MEVKSDRSFQSYISYIVYLPIVLASDEGRGGADIIPKFKE
jgi:hypothetical protein